MRTLAFHRHAIPLLAMLLLVPGCSGRPSQASVVGTVELNGKPLAKGDIVLEGSNSRSASGKIVDGKIIDIMTYKAGDGVTLGPKRIAITSYGPNPKASDPAHAMEPGPSLIPTRYNDPATSGLTHEIVSGENKLELKLTSP